MPLTEAQQYVADLLRERRGAILLWDVGAGASTAALAAAGRRRVVYVASQPLEAHAKREGYRRVLGREVAMEVLSFPKFARQVKRDASFLRGAFLVLDTDISQCLGRRPIRDLVGRLNEVDDLRLLVLAARLDDRSAATALALCRRAEARAGRVPEARCARRDAVRRALCAASEDFSEAVASLAAGHVQDRPVCFV